MKSRILLAWIIMPLAMLSCKKDDGGYIQIKGIEHLVYVSIKTYRTDHGKDGPFVHQPLLIEEAQRYSYKMAIGYEEVGLQGIQEHWDALEDKYDFYNRGALVLKTDSNDEDEILAQLLQAPEADSLLLGDLTQCGVGIEVDTAGFNYVTVLLAKADS
jgi:hypothetical protein